MGLPLASAVHFSKWQRWHAFKDAKSYLRSCLLLLSFSKSSDLDFGFWILDFRGDENIRREIDNVERCVWRWNNWTRRIFGKILSGVWWKFGFSFFLILKFRENSKSHRVVEMLEDIWDGEWKGNDRVFFCRRMGENDDGGCGDQWWIRFFKKDTHFSPEYLHLPI